MSKLEHLKLDSLLKKKEAVKPRTYLDELASLNLLDDYVENYFGKKLEKDEDFKQRVFESYYTHSNDTNENLELYYLEEICRSLSYFIEYTKACRIPER
ncbi:hypothetical protein MASR1M45_00600 [Candidatus Kapaibacterium sp.]